MFAPDRAAECAALVRTRTDLSPRLGMVLGSGLGSFADTVADAVRIPFADLPGFPVSTVTGHRGELVIGRVGGVPIALLSGRAHYYEHGDAAAMKTPIATFAALGCEGVILTNAAGGLDPAVGPGELMLISDHINFAGTNPLFGEMGDRRFVGMTQAYDAGLADLFRAAAAAEDIRLSEGVYMWFTGPSFETPAEIRAARILGAQAVGMSTVPEVILARFYGLRVAAVSTVTNFAAGMTGAELSHEETKENGPKGAEKLKRLLPRVVAAFGAS
ncbi:purine-nucleoside phosphorylase [Oharaeibacter diazotrophicus]|uniref:Purine nucleoside phosphorylase n=1 Tax=Oharaeibacter diazotrophicus TaxID=1920512 RepID=A0A4R6RD88_9HYPH|nr:purine-nucleoside phosphorylase [Oharaeibacter diazotrophicus]TDP84153.1 purine-nucleoside phosphorylase [Oharaeibacter diazotrophicus]BBE73190.1 purine nucleoside phosphorylase 1 [Pleomorphomonas sp. SM30]GLS74980.1 purine nucleoside phosphorylase [Oharaeibacter diazotrophicus]